MLERQSIDTTKLVFDPDPFAPDFKSDMNRMVVEESVESAGKALVAALPLALTACSPTTSEIQEFLNPASIAGHLAGTALAIEEAFEKDLQRNLGRKAFSVVSKYCAGFLAGHAVVHNEESGASWLSGENLPNSLSFIPAAYVIVKETSLPQLLDRFKSNVTGKVSAVGEQRRQAEAQLQLERLADDAFSSRIKTQNLAREQAKRLGISPQELYKIHHRNDR